MSTLPGKAIFKYLWFLTYEMEIVSGCGRHRIICALLQQPPLNARRQWQPPGRGEKSSDKTVGSAGHFFLSAFKSSGMRLSHRRAHSNGSGKCADDCNSGIRQSHANL